MTAPETPKTYLSGVQPSGDLHLGNYFGAIRQHIAAQDNAYYFIADYHALTTQRDPQQVRDNVYDIAATYLALGLDPDRAVMWAQSDVPEVTELAWLLACVTGKGMLDRATSYKDKEAKGLTASVGLYTYPVLMAADILAFDADIVPVGSDQVQHVEMARDMAKSFNSAYGEVFKLPKFELGVPVPVPGIDGDKMSKSYGNAIPIIAPSKKLRKRVMKITTDSTPLEEAKDPTGCTVVELYKLMATSDEVAALELSYRTPGFGYGEAKQVLFEKLEEVFGAARAERERLDKDPAHVYAMLKQGADRARPVARAVLNRARKACGID